MLGNPPMAPYGMDLNDNAAEVENHKVMYHQPLYAVTPTVTSTFVYSEIQTKMLIVDLG
jgi:hypothetical protein